MLADSKAFGGFSVDDIPAAKAFYGEVLGLDVSEMDMQGYPLLNIRLGSGSNLLVYPKPDHRPATFTILNFPVPDIEASVRELKQRGVAFEHYDAEAIRTDADGICRNDGGPLVAWFRDPAGNVLSVIEEREPAGN